MKQSRKQLWVSMGVLGVVLVVLCVILLGMQKTPERTAETFLKAAYTAAPEDYDEFSASLAQNEAAAYFDTRLGGVMTEEALQTALQNRSLMAGITLAAGAQAPAKVSGITLKTVENVGGDKAFDYTATTTAGGTAQALSGRIQLVKDGSAWKISGFSLQA